MTKGNEIIVVKVRGNKYQKLITIPKNTSVKVGDYLKIIKWEVIK